MCGLWHSRCGGHRMESKFAALNALLNVERKGTSCDRLQFCLVCWPGVCPCRPQAYTLDGNLADWGLTRTGSVADWTPNSQIKAWAVEDQTGGLNTKLTPGYGGQAYDVDAQCIDYAAQYLYLALVTGHNSLTPNGGNSFAPGDFAFDFGRDGSYEFGLETTGSNGNSQGGCTRLLNGVQACGARRTKGQPLFWRTIC